MILFKSNMLIVDDILVTDDLKDVRFSCNLTACKGECCVAGDAGAPLDEEEISILEDEIDEILPYVPEKGKEVIERIGVFEYDMDGTYVTPLVNNEECAFVPSSKGDVGGAFGNINGFFVVAF